MPLTHQALAELASVAVQVAEEGADLARAAFDFARDPAVHKGEVDLVTETDLAVEALLRELLTVETGFDVLGEEGGLSGARGGLTWIVDPIDGTTNFAHRFPHFAVSIGLWDLDAATPLVGVVNSPMHRESFWCDGENAYLNDDRLPQLTPVLLDVALLGSGFPYDRRTNPDDNTDLWRAFMKRCQGVRRMGAAALDLAWLAAGRLDGFWEARLKPWDAAAGLAILERVGGRAVEYGGAPHRLDSESLVAAHPELLESMLEVIATERRPR